MQRRVASVLTVAALMLSTAACGGGDDTSFSTPDSTTTTEAVGDDATADQAMIDELRASEAFSESDFTSLSTDQQNCVLSSVAADDALAAAAIANTDPTDAQSAQFMAILLRCAPENIRELMSDGDATSDAMLAALSDEQLACIVDELVADPSVLNDTLDGSDGVAMGVALLGCAPDVVAESMAEELGVTAEQAACLLDEDGVLMQLMLAGDDISEDDAFNFIDDMLGAYEDCGIDVTDLMGDVGDVGDGSDTGDTTGDGTGISDEALAEFRDQCTDGDLEACDALFFQSEVGSDDEEFGATCGGTTDGSTAGMCSYVAPSDEELAGYRDGCAAGDMEACDELYYRSDFGSDDEEFGATCGGTTDGTEPGSCSLDG